MGDIENMPEEWAQKLEDAGYDDLDSVINATADDLTALLRAAHLLGHPSADLLDYVQGLGEVWAEQFGEAHRWAL